MRIADINCTWRPTIPTLELTPEQELLITASAEPIQILIKNATQRYVVVSEEVYQKMQDLLQIDEVEDSLFEFEDLPDEA